MNMKQRQTFTLSPEVSNRAKQYARRKGRSLSSLVEELLREKTGVPAISNGSGSESRSFSQRWAGKGTVSTRNDERSRRLRGKYGL